MDVSTQLVQAYLHVNGYFTTTEYPLVETRHGRAQGESQHVIRMVLFASRGDRTPGGWHWVHLDHVFRFLDSYLYRHRRVLASVDLRDPALSWLSLLRKCEIALSSEIPSP